jgi:CheY-like chemotaxis protein
MKTYGHILLVEDNEDDILMTERALKKARLLNELVVARDGEEALDYLFGTGRHADRDTSDQPQIILLDLNMPKVGGLEVLRRIRDDERTKLLPVVVLTTSDDDRDRVESYRLSCNSYVQKPVEFDQFSKAVAELGFYWLLLNQTAPKTKPQLSTK